MNTHKK